MSKYNRIVLSELSEEERADLRDLYHVLFMGAVKYAPKDKKIIMEDFVKPILDENGIPEDSLYRIGYESFILGVNAGIEYAEFMRNSLEKE